MEEVARLLRQQGVSGSILTFKQQQGVSGSVLTFKVPGKGVRTIRFSSRDHFNTITAVRWHSSSLVGLRNITVGVTGYIDHTAQIEPEGSASLDGSENLLYGGEVRVRIPWFIGSLLELEFGPGPTVFGWLEIERGSR